MGDCNLSLLYNDQKCSEKICKYSYTSWCPTCDRNPPRRRRSRSETTESCRRKCKEMKTFTPKKYYTRSREYEENMGLGYDLNDCLYFDPKEYRGDCCRVRANLCELPTTYISNNCQSLNNCNLMPTHLSKLSNGAEFVNCAQKNVKTYGQTLKFVDGFDNHRENLETMAEKSRLTKLLDDREFLKLSPTKLTEKQQSFRFYESLKSPTRPLCLPIHKQHVLLKTKPVCQLNGKYEGSLYCKNIFKQDNHMFASDDRNDYVPHNRLENHVHNCIYDAKSDKPELARNQNGISFETCTFFDNKKNDTAKIKDDYSREMEVLREKLVVLKKNAYSNSQPRFQLPVKNANAESNKEQPVHNVNSQGDVITKNNNVNLKTTVIRKKGIISPPLLKSMKSRVSLKTRGKVNSVKLRKAKVKNVDSKTDSFQTECTGSDESEEEPEINEDSEQSTEPSTGDSKGRSSEDISVPRTILQPGGGDTIGWPARQSLFPNIPPYIDFNSYDSEVAVKVPYGRRLFQWKLSTITPVLVRKTLTNSGFTLIRKSNQWMGTWGKHMKSPGFQTLKETQKLNHFPGTFQLGRKDRLWRNFQRLISRFGTREFGFLPHTYILPQELRLLKQNWEYKNGSGGEMWIIKPPASARGVGIKVINKWSQLPKKLSLVVQKYISNPYLINGSKFDLRLYVLVTSFNPMRIYLYPEGLARFASAKYSEDAKDLKDRYMHLTNYSINKFSSHYTPNEDADSCQGHKWTISKLFQFMQEERGVDTKALWRNLEQLVIKTMITSEEPIIQLCDENIISRYNCYELFGVDVLLDERLKPWLLEVNISPSLHSTSPLDAHVKGPMVQTLFNLAQFHFPPKLARASQQSPRCYDPRLYTTLLTKKERQKHSRFSLFDTREEYIDDILDVLTGDDVRHLTQAEDEFCAKGRFQRIFPTSHSYKYLHFMDTRYYNRLFDAWETRYESNRAAGIARLQELCEQRIHLKVAPQPKVHKELPNTNPVLLPSLQPAPAQPAEDHSRPLAEVMQEVTISNNVSSY